MLWVELGCVCYVISDVAWSEEEIGSEVFLSDDSTVTDCDGANSSQEQIFADCGGTKRLSIVIRFR